MDEALKAAVNKRERMGTAQEEGRSMREILSAQPKMMITLHQSRPGEDQLPDKFVSINGHNYQVRRGESMEVPMSVYLLLVQGGEVPPQRMEDRVYVPRMTYAFGKPLSEQVPQNAQ